MVISPVSGDPRRLDGKKKAVSRGIIGSSTNGTHLPEPETAQHKR